MSPQIVVGFNPDIKELLGRVVRFQYFRSVESEKSRRLFLVVRELVLLLYRREQDPRGKAEEREQLPATVNRPQHPRRQPLHDIIQDHQPITADEISKVNNCLFKYVLGWRA